MTKDEMRQWVADLELFTDKKLVKWKKNHKIENGESVQLSWQFEQTHCVMNVFWEDNQETVVLDYFGPRESHTFVWHGLNDETFNRTMDRVGNLAQVTQYRSYERHGK